MNIFKKVLFLAFVLISVSSFAAGVPSPATPRLQVDANGTLVSDSDPLPVVGTLSVSLASATFSASGALEVYPSDYNTGSTSYYTPAVGGSVIRVVIATGAKKLDLWATGTFEYYNGSTTVTASAVPCFSVTDIQIGTSAIIMVGQTATVAKIQATQTGQ